MLFVAITVGCIVAAIGVGMLVAAFAPDPLSEE